MASSESLTVPNFVVVNTPRNAMLSWTEDRSASAMLFHETPEREAFLSAHTAYVETLKQMVRRGGPSTNKVRVVQVMDVLQSLPEEDPDKDKIITLASTLVNLTYTRDSTWTLPWAPGFFFKSSMKEQLRRAETRVMSKCLETLGLREMPLQTPLREGVDFLEGGDIIPVFAPATKQRLLFIGYGPRSTRLSIDSVYETVVMNNNFADGVVAVELDQDRMNLDGVLVPFSQHGVLLCKESVVSYERLSSNSRCGGTDIEGFLSSLGFSHQILVPKIDGIEALGANSFVFAPDVLLYDNVPQHVSTGVMKVLDTDTKGKLFLAKNGVELAKGRGGCRCMSRPVYLRT